MPKHMERKDWGLLPGTKVGYWTILNKGTPKNKNDTYLCRCVCGTVKEVFGSSFRGGCSQSCGCMKGKYPEDFRTRLYNIWRGILVRVKNPNRHNSKSYLGKGIKLYSDWYDFNIFKEWALKNGYSETLTIDRKNNNGNYEPDNCRWVTPLVQANNTSHIKFPLEERKQIVKEAMSVSKPNTIKAVAAKYNMQYDYLLHLLVKERRGENPW